jgi:hypothetical protein
MQHFNLADIPDVRDGLTRVERVILYCLHQCQQERQGGFVPTVMLYGRVVEHIDITEQELVSVLQRFSNYNEANSRGLGQDR